MTTRWWPRIRRVWITLGVTLTVVFVSWSLIAYQATSAARGAALTDANVSVTHEDGIWLFVPATGTAARSERGLVFFPGALVSSLAYAPIARAAAMIGHPSAIIDLPNRGAFGGANDPKVFERARRLMHSVAGTTQWIIAGHSRGAVVATSVAAERWPEVAGVVLLGTTHPRDVDLSGLEIPVTKVVGTNDRIAPIARSEENRALLPTSTRWVRIEGANHSQFGWYGFQPGDGMADVSREEQHATVINAVNAALR